MHSTSTQPNLAGEGSGVLTLSDNNRFMQQCTLPTKCLLVWHDILCKLKN
jgi:hypothetical protein